jgi:predicted amidohydrolase YtcJ
MELLGINADTVGQYGDYAERWPDGTPNGVVKEIVLDDIKCNLPAPSLEQLLDKMIQCQTDLFEKGITSIQSDDFKYFPDGGAYDMMERIRKASDKGIFKLRMAEQALMYNLEEMETFFDQYGWDDSFGNRSFRIACIKLLADGSLGARTAYLRKPYADDPSTQGLLLFPADQLKAIKVSGMDKNFQINIGDKDENGNFYVTINNKVVDSELFSDFYSHVLMIGITDVGEKGKEPLLMSLWNSP